MLIYVCRIILFSFFFNNLLISSDSRYDIDYDDEQAPLLNRLNIENFDEQQVASAEIIEPMSNSRILNLICLENTYELERICTSSNFDINKVLSIPLLMTEEIIQRYSSLEELDGIKMVGREIYTTLYGHAFLCGKSTVASLFRRYGASRNIEVSFDCHLSWAKRAAVAAFAIYGVSSSILNVLLATGGGPECGCGCYYRFYNCDCYCFVDNSQGRVSVILESVYTFLSVPFIIYYSFKKYKKTVIISNLEIDRNE